MKRFKSHKSKFPQTIWFIHSNKLLCFPYFYLNNRISSHTHKTFIKQHHIYNSLQIKTLLPTRKLFMCVYISISFPCNLQSIFIIIKKNPPNSVKKTYLPFNAKRLLEVNLYITT